MPRSFAGNNGKTQKVFKYRNEDGSKGEEDLQWGKGKKRDCFMTELSMSKLGKHLWERNIKDGEKRYSNTRIYSLKTNCMEWQCVSTNIFLDC